MKVTYKTEIKPNNEQKIKINQNIGVCRYLYNSYVAKNIELYKQYKDDEIDKKESFMNAYDFDKYINNEVKVLDEYDWINLCGSKARKKSICNAETAFKRFFKKQSKFPRFKKKNNQDVKLYYPKNNKSDWTIERHRIKIPTFGWVRLKEFGYIPKDKKVISGTISRKVDRYYVSILIEEEHTNNTIHTNKGIGIDLGISDFAILSDNSVYRNINKQKAIRKLNKRLKREQKRLSRKYESSQTRNKNIKEGRATRKNIEKQIVKVQKLHQRLANIRTDYINKTVNEIIKRKPSYIVIEDLNISGMMKNRHLSKAISQQKFYEFRIKLEYKCKLNNIELRIVDRFYPSSKLCNSCGNIKKDLKLSERTYICKECGYTEDRDVNASLNLRDAKIYKIA